MRVRMLRTVRGAVDHAGVVIETHTEGCWYELPQALAMVYIGAGYAAPDDEAHGPSIEVESMELPAVSRKVMPRAKPKPKPKARRR